MLFLSFGLWCVVVYSLRVAVLGNPLYGCLAHADPGLLHRAEQITQSGRAPANDDESAFLQRFSRLTLLEVVLFVLEIALLIYLCGRGLLRWLSGGLLAKDGVMVALGLWVAHRQAVGGLFESLLALPAWMVWVDRASSLVSGVGFLALFLHVNGLGLSIGGG